MARQPAAASQPGYDGQYADDSLGHRLFVWMLATDLKSAPTRLAFESQRLHESNERIEVLASYDALTSPPHRLLAREEQVLAKSGAALANQDFLLYYQPQIELRSGRIIGAEALIR